MAYTEKNFQSKKELKEALDSGKAIHCYSPGPFPLKSGKITLEGPHYPQPHKWYATVTIDESFAIIPGSLK